MNFRYKTIKVDSLPVYDNDSSIKFETYLVSIPFNDLIKICKIKSISTNRGVDEVRALKMSNYIKNENAFYPPLIISSNNKEQINFNEMASEISISDVTDDTNTLTIIDGQHRFKSIELMMAQEEICLKNQAVFIINGISDLKRREIFIDINDNAKRVSTGDKERYKISLSNYFGLKYIEASEYISKIDWGANQMKLEKKIPYKFIANSIKIVLDDYEKPYKKGEFILETISWFSILNKKIWDCVFEKYYDNQMELKLIETEVILLSIFRLYKPIFSDFIKDMDMTLNSDENIEVLAEGFFELFERFLGKDVEIEKVKSESTSVSEKKNELNNLFNSWGWTYA